MKIGLIGFGKTGKSVASVLIDYFGEDHPGISAITTHLC